MPRYFILLPAFLFLFISACAPDDEKKSTEPVKKAITTEKPAFASTQAKSEAVISSDSQTGAPETKAVSENSENEDISDTTREAMAQPVSAEEYDWADRMLLFSNKARNDFEQTFENSAASINESVKSYLETWHLGKTPKIVQRKSIRENMEAPAALFSPEEEKILAQSLASMDKALEEMTRHYNELKKYVSDDSIHDDGKKGRALGKQIAGNYEKFVSARHDWLEVVEKRAQEAEEKFLRTHPLQRQIAGARTIFAQFREIASMINKGVQNNGELMNLRQTIEKIISECAKPPFNASPGLERQYRQFLNLASQYCRTLDRAIAEGLHDTQKREINEAVAQCRKSYNEFVRSANFLTSHLPVSSPVGQNQPSN